MALIRRNFLNLRSNRIVLRCLGCNSLIPRGQALHDQPYSYTGYTPKRQEYRLRSPIRPTTDNSKLMNLCVIGAGKNGTAKSLLLRIGDEGYLFNCGEGTARALADRRLLVNIKNIFFTHLNWENLGGVIGFCMTMQGRLFTNSDFGTIGLYGPASMKQLFAHSRSFARFHRLELESLSSHECHIFENKAVLIESVIFYPKLDEKTALEESKPINMLDLALYVKSGQSSRKSENEAVFYIISPKVEELESKKIVVVDCPNEQFLHALLSSERLQEFYSDNEEAKQSCLDVIVHLSPISVVDTEKYQQWIRQFGPSTKHLLINEGAPENPVTKSYSLQSLLNAVDPDIWPMLSAQQVVPSQIPLDLNVYRGSPGLFYSFMGSMEGKFYRDRKELIMRRPHSLLEPYHEELKKIQSQTGKMMKDLNLSPQKHHYPEVVFLGTGATKPTDIRNLACILVHLSPDKAILMDCGESAYDQLVAMYGSEEAEKVLRKIKVIFITHMHPDHHLGLVSILHHRHKLHCKDRVHLIGPQVLNVWMNLVDHLVTPVQHLARFITTESFIKRSLAYTNKTQLDLAQALDLQELDIFRASHSQHASSIAITHNDGWKLVYSGDSNPGNRMVKHGENCDLLIHEATFPDERLGAAIYSSHCTVSEAVDMGVKAKAKHVLFTHISHKYNKNCLPDLSQYEDQLPLATAFDFMRVKLWQLPLLCLYQDILFRLMNEYYRYGSKLVTKMKAVYTKD